MHIYHKRTLRNRIKQGMIKALALALMLAGLVSLLNLGIDYLSQLNRPIVRYIQIKDKDTPDVLSFLEYEAGTTANAIIDPEPLSIEDKIKSAFPEMPEIMLAIAKAESGLNPNAINYNTNGSIDTGIFQINSIHKENINQLKDPDHNIKVARKILASQGLTAWVAYQSGAYLKYL